MPPTTLDDWLDYQQRAHPHAIQMGLERVREVWMRLGAPAPARVVIAVGGTNGKGSTVAFLDAILSAAGQRVGAYTSPHLLRYNERVRVAGLDTADATLVAAFARIEAARGAIPLTYFEYGTLAALWIFAHSDLDVALLEVGLGGRLDAVNLIDADAAIVTTVDLDHQAWLGNDRQSIGYEKAGIFRGTRPAIIGESDPPHALLEQAWRMGADVHVFGRDFFCVRDTARSLWRWQSGADELVLPMPQLHAPCQLANASAAITALHTVRPRLGWNPQAIAAGVANARIGARLQIFAGEPALIVDVAHNPQAARVLAHWLRATRGVGRTLAVFGALDDKDVRGIVAALNDAIDAWFIGGLDGDSPRGLAAERLREILGTVVAIERVAANIPAALAQAFGAARVGDRVIAFGSFFVAAAALGFAHERGLSM
ncbi:MAG: bifunctional tetrahydrofolate synthase/dihydrofolate synthase [Rhodanobacter sp.]|jgi:dihydrofolate synthase/folylpolyglutamate synthase|nr:bifunctional tetrahydrofolate synthase/dihydrofolate synthase [Rhodanobacter sp.]